MIEIRRPQDLMRLRRIALAAQGLLQTEPFGFGLDGTHKAINHLGYVQLDTISVVERAHHHVFHSRVPKFKPEMVNAMLVARDIFEYWSHAAAVLPIADFRFSLPYKHAIKSGQKHWNKTPDKKMMTELLARIACDGPMRSRDLEANTESRTGWWDWKPAKKALEQLYMEGDIMVANRDGFQKVYDLTERVLPSSISLTLPSSSEFAEHMLEQQLRCHGFASLKGLTYLRKNTELRNEMKALVNNGLAQRTLEKVQLADGEIFIIEAGAFEQPLPRLSHRLLILSPFDNSLIQRDRLRSLFEFDYQLECYLPASKRQFGYFSLPLLYRGEFIGRMDSKVHRKTGHLEIKSLHFEKHSFDEGAVLMAFTKAIKLFCEFQQCGSVSLTCVEPKHLFQRLRGDLNF